MTVVEEEKYVPGKERTILEECLKSNPSLRGFAETGTRGSGVFSISGQTNVSKAGLYYQWGRSIRRGILLTGIEASLSSRDGPLSRGNEGLLKQG